jgi:uncharacterized membrane protein (UPF0136 family)
MEEQNLEVIDSKNSQAKIIIVGVVSGALLGLAAAYLLAKNAEQKGEKIEITLAEALRLGLLAIGLIRNVARL